MTGDWQWLTLADVLVPQSNRKLVQQGWSPQCHDFPARDNAWGVLKTTAIQFGSFEPQHNKELPETLAPKPQIEVRRGDLLMTCAGPRARCGVPTLVKTTPGRLMMSGKMYRFRPDERLVPQFLEYWLLSPDAQRLIDSMKTGISDSGLNLTHARFTRLPVPVPPLVEQHRIISLLDDHLSRLEAADSYLRSAESRESALDTQVLAAELAQADTHLVPFSSLLRSGLANGRSVPTRAGGFPVLRLTALREGRIALNERKEGAWTKSDASRFLIERGDFLISRGNGSLRLVGAGGLVVEEPDAVAYPDTLVRAQLDTSVLNPSYLAVVWNSPVVRRQIEAFARTTAGIYKINQQDIGAVKIPVASLEHQATVVTRVGNARDALAVLATSRLRALRRSTALRRSLLTAAFSNRAASPGPRIGHALQILEA